MAALQARIVIRRGRVSHFHRSIKLAQQESKGEKNKDQPYWLRGTSLRSLAASSLCLQLFLQHELDGGRNSEQLLTMRATWDICFK